MAQCKQTPQEFIQNVFSPSVAVLCSADAENVCQKNNLSFEELVQPFCRLTSEAALKVPPNQSISVRNLRIVIKDLNCQLPQVSVIKKILNDSVSSSNSGHDGSRSVAIKKGNYELQLPTSLPWFESYRECFFDIIYPSDHEFTKHFLACLFVVSTSHPNPNAELVKLSQQQHQIQHQNPGKPPKWFSPNTLKAYVLLHDITDGEQYDAEAAFQSMKSAFPGSFCHLLQINSQPLDENQSLHSTSGSQDGAQPPDPWSQFLIRKIDQYVKDQGSDYDSSPRTPQEDNIFPNKVTEGDPELENNHIPEEGTEMTEELMLNPQDIDVNTISHPLTPEEPPITFKMVSDKSNLKIECVNEKDTPLASFIANNKVVYPQEIPAAPRPHGLCLTVSDLDRIRIFIHEFAVRGLITHVERQIKLLTETMATSRKKFHRSLLNATKKWLVGNKPGYQGPNAPTNTVVYSPEATELQVRKLGDLAFMFQHYELAYQAFHAAKQDFNSDQAWLHYAGALEMAALAIFMLGSNSQRPYPIHYMENAVNTYLNICKLPHFATRCTLLSSECLKSKNLFSEAAMQLIKMTCEDSDLQSALLLEQAAYCFTAMQSTMVRKYAFHMVLAGYRFNKAGQRKHALRAYKHAYQAYQNRNWSLAEDHINFSIGRQSYNLKMLEQALLAFQNLLKENSLQPISQQTSFLKEYLFIYNLMPPTDTTEDGTDLFLPLPIIDCQEIKIVLGNMPSALKRDGVTEALSVSFEDDEADDEMWFKLEELTVEQVQGSVSPLFKPSIQRLTGRTNNFERPLAVVTEPILVEIPMKNPLSIPLMLTDIKLLWKFQKTNKEAADLPSISNEAVTNVASDTIKTQVISNLELDSCQTAKVHLQLTPMESGKLNILGISYNLSIFDLNQSTEIGENRTTNSTTAQGKQYFKIRGPRLNNTKAEKTSQTYGPDFRLDPVVVPPMPSLGVNFHKFPTTMLCGEIQQVNVEFVNNSQLPIAQLHLCFSAPQYFSFGSDLCSTNDSFHSASTFTSNHSTDTFAYVDSVDKSLKTTGIPTLQRVSRVPVWLSLDKFTHLPAGASCKLPLWVRAPDQAGKHKLSFLFYYESDGKNSKMRNRVLRHSVAIDVINSLNIEAIAIRSHGEANDSGISLSVAMEVENTNDIPDQDYMEINLMQISSASKFWTLESMSISSRQQICIKPRESAHLCFRAVHLKPKDLKANTDQTLIFSNIAFNEREINSSLTPCSDFCHRSRVSFPDVTSEEYIFQSQPASYSAPTSLADEQFKALESTLRVRLSLIILWKAIVNSDSYRSSVMGQHHIFIDNINSLVSTAPEVKQAADKPFRIIPDPERPLPPPRPQASLLVLTQLVQCTMLHPDQVEHPFDVSRTCSVYVNLVLYNCSHLSLQVVVDTSKTSDSFPLQNGPIGQQPSGYLATYQASVATNFAWVGSTLISLPSLMPRESRKIQLRAAFYAPGTYNMGSVYVGVRRVTSPEEQLTQQRPCPPSLMLVKSVTMELKSYRFL
uniref:Trafficking protein particle complex subunit 8 n=1 Tax=Strigamia maritima TaxID=126957 RepID=T1J0M8_STRMM